MSFPPSRYDRVDHCHTVFDECTKVGLHLCTLGQGASTFLPDMETCQLTQAEEAIGKLTKNVNPFNHWRFVRGATRPIFLLQVLESEMSNQDSGAKIDGVDVNQVCVQER